MADRTERLAILAHRVQWLDRYRRAIAIIVAVIVGLLCMQYIDGLAGLLGICVWWTVEVILAWVTAYWEVQHDRLAADGGLPAARIVRVGRGGRK